jgi:GWxTD domain-containing protein
LVSDNDFPNPMITDSFRNVARAVLFSFAMLVFAQIFLTDCGSSGRLTTDARAKTIRYQIGLPNFDIDAIARVLDTQPGIDIHLSIPYRSLTFVQSAGRFVAPFTVTARLLRGSDETQVIEREWVDTARAAQYEMTQRFDLISLRKRLNAAPGEYLAEVAVQDRNSEKRAVRSQQVEIFSPDDPHPQLSRLWLEGRKEAGVYVPVVSLQVPMEPESLRARTVLYQTSGASDGVAELRVIRVKTDTSVALTPYAFTPMVGTLVNEGIAFEKKDTLAAMRQSFPATMGEMMIDFALPLLPKGMYILEERVVLTPSPGTFVELQDHHEVAIKDARFPRPTTIDALIEPLKYIASADEYEEIRAAKTPEEKRSRFEKFWLTAGHSQEAASNLIKQYYGRIEEANLLFSTFKEGWKTDRGMVYVILGPPSGFERRLDMEYWGYGEQNPPVAFAFRRAPGYDPNSLFENFLLVRQDSYYSFWTRAVDRWRRGAIL